MKPILKCVGAAFVIAVFNFTVSACPWCRAQVKGGVYDASFSSNLFVLLMPLAILAGLGFGLYHWDKILCTVRVIKRWLR